MSKSTKTTVLNKNLSTRPKISDKETKKDPKTNEIKTSKSTKTDTVKKSTSKNEDKLTTNTTKQKGPITSKSKISTAIKTTTERKPRNVGTIQKPKTDTKSQPLRARHAPEILNSLKNAQSRTVNKSNVMNSVHNVTVSSPPSTRKEIRPVQIPTTTSVERKPNKISKNTQDDSRSRTRTRTLDPDEVVVLKKPGNDKAGPRSLDASHEKIKNQATKISGGHEPNEKDPTSVLKEAVAFEINFDDKKQKEKSETKRTEKKTSENDTRLGGPKILEKSKNKVDPDDYDDDFESYESDFETGSSSAEASESVASSGSEDEISTENVGSQSDNSEGPNSSDTDNCDESEETQPPITVIHREKDDERKLDSGNYDMQSRREKLQQIKFQQQQQQQQQLDSIDTITGNSEQLDSGISYNGNTTALSASSPTKSTSASSTSTSTIFTSGALNATEKLSKFTKRGMELMRKIQLDEIDYTLFDLKPISYEYYMKVYGNVNAIQNSTQTNENRMNADTQTNECQYRSTWTQHPPQYDLNFIQNRNLRNLQNFCGEFDDDKENENSGIDANETDDVLLRSLKALQKFRREELKRAQNIQKPVNFDRLNEFLNQTVFTISGILNKSNRTRKIQNSKDMNSISKGYFTLNTNFINALKVVKIFANSNLNIILTVHESLDGVYRSEFLNLMSVWSVSESEKPIRLLSSWSEVCRADVCSENPDIIVCGLRDGSIAMWDLRETYSFCSKLDGCLRHFPATQSIAPILNTNELKLIDLGAVVDIKSFRKSNKIYDFKTYKPIQIVSLNDTGILTIWTLIETGSTIFTPDTINHRSKHTKIEYNSPWARVKLIQSEICDLREYLELKNVRIRTDFEKTKSYFENDLFNDDALKELQETQNELKLGLQGLRFTNLDTGIERIYIGTNRNFIIACTKTLRTDQFRKIVFDETKFLFSTTFRLLKSEEYLVVGLSNGSVMAINCNLNKLNDQKQTDDLSIDDFNRSQSNASRNNDDFEFESGKSCAIQNIIRNERKLISNAGKSDSRQSSFDEMNAIQKFNDEDYFHIFDQQILLSGSILRKNLVQSIEVSSDGKKLFVLADGKQRMYDFIIGKEISETRDSNDIHGLAMAKDIPSNQNLLILMKNDEVQVHTLK